jgi:hypothetical protein
MAYTKLVNGTKAVELRKKKVNSYLQKGARTKTKEGTECWGSEWRKFDLRFSGIFVAWIGS